ncbi:MAG: hypothetical protein A2X79_00515 [Desulfuromonadaceae bacterium GWB2_53_15]|nr:MAG: hypothetical protein A2X79_00515 [Desulfuromonadaceae bacterium GWB2_53_15]
MSGWVVERPASTAPSNADLVCSAAVTTEAILVAADMAAIRQLTTRHDLAIVVRVNLDVVQRLGCMTLFAGSNLETCFRLGIVTPHTFTIILTHTGIMVGLLVGIYQLAGAPVITPRVAIIAGSLAINSCTG